MADQQASASPGTVRTFLGAESLSLRLIAGLADGDDRPVSAVVPVAGLADIDDAPAGALVVVMPDWEQRLDGYQVDVALRHAVEAGIGGLVFGGRRTIGSSTVHLADRAGLPLLDCSDELSGWRLLLALDRRLRQPDAELTARVRQGVAAVTSLTAPAADAVGSDPAPHVSVERLLTAASDALGRRIRFLSDDRPHDDGSLADGSLADGSLADGSTDDAGAVGPETAVTAAAALPATSAVRQPVRARRPGRLEIDDPDPAAELVMPLLAAEVARVLDDEQDAALRPARARSQVVLQLLLADRSHVGDVAEAAVRTGLPIHQTHVGGWLVITAAERQGDQDSPEHRQRSVIDRVETELWSSAPDGTLWHVTPMADGIALCCTGDAGSTGLYRAARHRVQDLVDRWDPAAAAITAGLGGAAAGAEGLRRSVAEARLTAERAMLAGRSGSLSDTDRVGLRRVLADLGSSPLSSGLLADVLAPLEELSADKAEVAVVTLNAYLDAQGSPSRAAAELHLHPNAVAYRLKWIGELLPVDLADPDQRFAVHLACRLHLQRLLASR